MSGIRTLGPRICVSGASMPPSGVITPRRGLLSRSLRILTAITSSDYHAPGYHAFRFMAMLGLSHAEEASYHANAVCGILLL